MNPEDPHQSRQEAAQRPASVEVAPEATEDANGAQIDAQPRPTDDSPSAKEQP